jgi:predicted Fe-Mo cluster-binding NifX family protein
LGTQEERYGHTASACGHSHQTYYTANQEETQMKAVVTATGEDGSTELTEVLGASISPVFGRCPTYIFVDTETLAFEAQPNPAIDAAGGAGIQAAQYVIQQDAQAVLTGNVGPNAFDVLQAADVPVYLIREGTVRQAVETFKAGQLQRTAQANVRAHAGAAALQDTARDLRQQLADVMTRIEKLEKEN